MEAQGDSLELLRMSILASTPPSLLTAASDPSPTLALASYLSFTRPGSSLPINIPKDAPTRFTSKAGSLQEFYNVGQLYLAWVERESGVRDYLMKGQAGGVGYVAITDRRVVVDYLTGAGDGAGRIVGTSTKGTQQQQVESAASTTAETLPLSLVSDLSAGSSGPSAPVKRKYEVDVVDREFCRKLRTEEVELIDRNSVLRTSNNGKINNFEAFLKNVVHEKIRTLRASFDKSSRQSATLSQSQAADPKRAKKARSKNPIIIISSSPTSLITMWNVKKFLEEGVFELSDTARQTEASQGNVKAEDMIPIIRKRTGPQGDVNSKYYVVDSADALQKFGQDAWDRVICVVTTGQAWQFKPYKWDDPKVLFQHVKGVYFQWSNEPVTSTVKEWNVKEMRIDRNKRHTDRQVVADFWRLLDSAKQR
nr:parafibromin [Cryptococcus depauperatus CBS 7841]